MVSRQCVLAIPSNTALQSVALSGRENRLLGPCPLPGVTHGGTSKTVKLRENPHTIGVFRQLTALGPNFFAAQMFS